MYPNDYTLSKPQSPADAADSRAADGAVDGFGSGFPQSVSEAIRKGIAARVERLGIADA